LAAWSEKEMGYFKAGIPLTEQQMGQIQGIVKFIDILLKG